jgi:predicted ATPase/class 3 adenylate cyclase
MSADIPLYTRGRSGALPAPFPTLGDLLSFVPAYIARQARSAPHRLQAPHHTRTTGAVLLADISGFTALSERLAQRGPVGAEVLTRLLNDFFGRLIEPILAGGGDVIQFAGDGLAAVWSVEDGSPSTAHAAASALRCAERIGEGLRGEGWPREEEMRLRVRLSIGAGAILHRHLGGVAGCCLHLLAGDAMTQALRYSAQAATGSIRLSPEAQAALAVLPASPLARASPGKASPPAETSPEMLAALHPYIAPPVRARLRAGHSQWLAELRPLTTFFLQVPQIDESAGLQRWQEAVCCLQEVLYRYEATISQIRCDEEGRLFVTGAFGLPPLSHEDDPRRAVRAALHLRGRLAQMGCAGAAMGLATRRVFCGAIGSSLRREYTMMGDAVNLAARLMQTVAAEPSGGILCDEATYLSALSGHTFEALPPVFVKGKSDPVPVYRPWERQPATEARLSPAAATPIIGRDSERTALAGVLERLLGRRETGPRSARIEGEAGIGKSRLLEDICGRARERGVRVAFGAGDAVETSTPFHGWRAIFTALLNLEDAVGGADAESLRRRIEAALSPGLWPEAPLLNAVLPHLDFPETPATERLSGDRRAERTRAFLVELLQSVAAPETPLLLVLEDAHWLDPASWALAQSAAQRLQHAGLILASRPLAAPPSPAAWLQDAGNSDVLHLPLTFLGEADTLSLVRACLGIIDPGGLPGALGSLIRRKAEGHPFFTEELAFALRDMGLIRLEEGVCRIAPGVDLDTVVFPDTVQAIITSRIDRLTPSQQLTLKVASVIGTTFALSLLRAVYPLKRDHPRIPRYLRALEARDLTLLHKPDPDPTYLFKHYITREVAYNLMLFEQRRALHRTVAERYEALYSEDLSPFYSLLAYHWIRAEDIPKAVAYHKKAAVQAFSAGLGRESVAIGLDAARLLGEDLPTEPARIVPLIREEMADIENLLAGRAPEELLDLPPLTDQNTALLLDLLLHIQPFAYQTLQPELFTLMALKVMSLTLRYGNGPLAAGVYSMYSVVHRVLTGDHRSAYAFSRLALQYDARQGSAPFPSVSFVHGWFNNHWLNPLETNLALSEEAAKSALALGDVLYVCFNLAAQVVYRAAMGRPLAEVEELADRHAQLNNGQVINALFHCVHERQIARALAGKTQDRLSLSDRECSEARDVASICDTAHFNQIGFYFVSRLRLHYYYRDYPGALAAAEKAEQLLPAFQGQIAEWELTFFQGLALLARLGQEADPAAARALRQAAERCREKLREWSALCPANFEHKRLLLEAEWTHTERPDADARAVDALFQRAAAAARAAGYIQYAALSQERAGLFHRSRGDQEAARRRFAAAREDYAAWGAWAKVADIEALSTS